MCARSEGDTVLRQQIIEPALVACPPFVVSDAFPGDWLPVPAALRLLDSPPERRKEIKRSRFLSRQSFVRIQRGELPTLADVIHGSGVREYTQLRNAISRSSNKTMDGGGLFPTRESVLDKDVNCLTVYARVESNSLELFWHLVQELERWGFGSDRSAGKGQFRLDSQLEPANDLADTAGHADGCLVLSTFQPAAADPIDGAWEAFTKYGKLGPDFGLENVFKRPMIVFRPGACFRGQPARGWMGRAIPMHELLAEDVIGCLNGWGASIVHWSFGLCVPLSWPHEEAAWAEPRTTAPADSIQPPPAEPQPLPPIPRTGHDPDKVIVKVLERRDIGGKVQFFVQEEGKPRGVLAYGLPPPQEKLPQVGDDIPVYRNNRDPRNPQYRWDKPLSYQDKLKGGRGRRPPGRR
jgi:CRISPR/Cas system CSM-associated protein Csm4 (group 5 of RAMP superfamily)